MWNGGDQGLKWRMAAKITQLGLKHLKVKEN